MALKKELTLITLVLYGVGIILGAGIYALIGTGASLAGNMLWLAFALATILAVFTGLSYAELSSMFPKEAAEYVYTKKAFGIESLSFILSWTMVIIGIISAAVVALAFGGYLSYMLGGDANLYAAGLIILLSALNYIGIKESVLFNNFASVIEALGLVAVIIIGFFLSGNTISELNLTELPPAGFHGIFSAIGVIFFAFIGFEYIANISEEVKDSKTVVPQAVIISLVISSVLYILLSIAILLLVPWEELASSPAPLTSAVGKSIPNASIIISIIALFATSNTVLIILIGSSRILYGMSSNKSLP
ncbi:amino acid permease, partial [Candidatus Micrarchaeota archaeon]|nr:amino acid permease [Candidatus Micrarchaeota archaeon]